MGLRARRAFLLLTPVTSLCLRARTADYLEGLVWDSKNGGKKALKDAVQHRLSKLAVRDRAGLFQWVDERSEHGYFILIMRGAAVELVKRYGSEIFIDR